MAGLNQFLNERDFRRRIGSAVRLRSHLEEFGRERNRQEGRTTHLQEDLDKLKKRDISSKIWTRVGITVFFALLLGLQNYFVFDMARRALEMPNVKELETLLSIVIIGTLTETYVIAKKIVEWMLTPIDYSTQA